MSNYNMIVGGICGAVAALVVYLAIGRTKLSDRTKGTISFLTFWILFSVVQKGGIPFVERYRMWSEMDEMPLFIALKTYEPVAYKELREKFEDFDPKNPAAVRAGAFGVVMDTAKKRVPRSSNEAAYDVMAATIDTIDLLYKRGDETCYQYLFKDQFPQVAFEAIVPREVMMREQRTMAEVIRSASKESQPIPTEESVAESFQTAGKSLSAQEIEGLQTLEGRKTLAERRASCAVASKFFRAILAQPRPQAGQTVRYLMAQS